MCDSSTQSRPLVCVLATGGTIAGAQTSDKRSGYHSAVLSIDALVAAVPQLTGIARLELRQVARIGSQDMDDALWIKLASECSSALARPEVSGLVITHGTDTMEETAYFLHLSLKSSKPVVLVGAMRPANSISADGPMNLYNAVAVAADRDAANRGVLVVANDEVHSARAVVKTNTTQVGTFRSINRGLAALVQQGRVQWFGRPSTRHTLDTSFSLDGIERLPRVEIIYAHAGMDSSLVNAARSAGAAGIVIAGVGSGNLHASALAAATQAAAAGLIVVRASRTGGGMVERNVELDDDQHRFVTAGDLNPQKARVLLQLALLTSRDPAQIQSWFDVC
jgi:L-asparaginase